MVAEIFTWLAWTKHQELMNEPKKETKPAEIVPPPESPSCAAYFDSKHHAPVGPNPKLKIEIRTISY